MARLVPHDPAAAVQREFGGQGALVRSTADGLVCTRRLFGHALHLRGAVHEGSHGQTAVAAIVSLLQAWLPTTGARDSVQTLIETLQDGVAWRTALDPLHVAPEGRAIEEILRRLEARGDVALPISLRAANDGHATFLHIRFISRNTYRLRVYNTGRGSEPSFGYHPVRSSSESFTVAPFQIDNIPGTKIQAIIEHCKRSMVRDKRVDLDANLRRYYEGLRSAAGVSETRSNDLPFEPVQVAGNCAWMSVMHFVKVVLGTTKGFEFELHVLNSVQARPSSSLRRVLDVESVQQAISTVMAGLQRGVATAERSQQSSSGPAAREVAPSTPRDATIARRPLPQRQPGIRQLVEPGQPAQPGLRPQPQQAADLDCPPPARQAGTRKLQP